MILLINNYFDAVIVAYFRPFCIVLRRHFNEEETMPASTPVERKVYIDRDLHDELMNFKWQSPNNITSRDIILACISVGVRDEVTRRKVIQYLRESRKAV